MVITMNPRDPSRDLQWPGCWGHITYLSEISMQRKFGRRFCNGNGPGFQLEADFEIGGYLRHQAKSFVERFDAQQLLVYYQGCDYFDASA